MSEFLKILLSGGMVGLVYSLIALGFVLIYKSSKIFNLAQGEFLLFGACIGWTFSTLLGLNILFAFFLTVISCALLGLLIERVFFRPLIGQPLISIIIFTLAVSMFLRGILIGIWWAPPYTFERIQIKFLERFLFSGFSVQYLICGFFSIALIVLFLLFFKFTKKGLALRAIAEDVQAAQVYGINIRKLFPVMWSIAAITGGLGGFFIGQILTVSAELASLGLIVFPVALIGGMDSVPGCIIGGIIIGIVENIAAVYLDPLLPHTGGLRMIAPYLLMLIILLIRPHGILGLKRIERI